KAQLMPARPKDYSFEGVRVMLAQALDPAREDATHFCAWRINTYLNRLKVVRGTPATRYSPMVH
ncbi:hypothetical protein EWW49_36190, partial [Pseudomonas syringae]